FGASAPSNLLAIGSIGTGRMGHGDMKECMKQGIRENARVIAVCDLDTNRAADAKRVVEKFYADQLGKPYECQVYSDYRELLARQDIDGVTISTPDHWHALCAVAAANAGKDMYIQKPLTYTIGEGRQLVAAVRAKERVLQTGSQQRSESNFRKACELVRNGRIGKLQTIHVALPMDSGTGDPEPMPVPSNLDYSIWLGPTPDAPYTEHRVHPQKDYSRPGWLQIEPYCRGMITGWGAHMNDTAQWGHGSDTTGPVEIEGTAEFPVRGLFNVHTKFQAEATYADGVKLIMKTASAGVKFEGSDGWVHVWRGGIDAGPKEILQEKIGPEETHLYVSHNHMADFLQCMRTRKDPIANVEIGHRSNSVCVLAHIAMKLGRKLRWNPEAEQFVDDDEANGFLDYTYREPWTLS
ncbi:MAG: Gfo/Idh/MocA family oxidoreductase, partial [Pirellulales bacterium]|nr:Gfo/Idh/MocA family oxidoreductase [Pirellulales bacterium]